MITEKIVEVIVGTVGFIGGIGIVLNRLNLLHFGKQNGKENPSGGNGFIVVKQCANHKEMVDDIINLKQEISGIKSDTSYIRGWIDAGVNNKGH